MKRYRLTNFFLDTSRGIFKSPQESGVMEVLREKMKDEIVSKYGSRNFEKKFERLMELEKPAISILVEDTMLLNDVCDTYISGNFYCAITGTCCLGERIFNNIISKVKEDFRASKYYKEIYDKGSIIDWDKAITILFDWKIIDSDIRKMYLRLYKLRTESVHFQKREQDIKSMSLEAINIVNCIINKLFAVDAHRKDALLYFDVPGEVFIRKKAEHDPIIKAFYLPCSVLVGPSFSTASGDTPGTFKIIDLGTYADGEISDDEFVRLRIAHKS